MDDENEEEGEIEWDLEDDFEEEEEEGKELDENFRKDSKIPVLPTFEVKKKFKIEQGGQHKEYIISMLYFPKKEKLVTFSSLQEIRIYDLQNGSFQTLPIMHSWRFGDPDLRRDLKRMKGNITKYSDELFLSCGCKGKIFCYSLDHKGNGDHLVKLVFDSWVNVTFSEIVKLNSSSNLLCCLGYTTEVSYIYIISYDHGLISRFSSENSINFNSVLEASLLSENVFYHSVNYKENIKSQHLGFLHLAKKSVLDTKILDMMISGIDDGETYDIRKEKDNSIIFSNCTSEIICMCVFIGGRGEEILAISEKESESAYLYNTLTGRCFKRIILDSELFSNGMKSIKNVNDQFLIFGSQTNGFICICDLRKEYQVLVEEKVHDFGISDLILVSCGDCSLNLVSSSLDFDIIYSHFRNDCFLLKSGYYQDKIEREEFLKETIIDFNNKQQQQQQLSSDSMIFVSLSQQKKFFLPKFLII